jgi:hypothetical protein
MPGGIIIDNAKKGDAAKLKVPALHSSLVKVLAQCRISETGSWMRNAGCSGGWWQPQPGE